MKEADESRIETIKRMPCIACLKNLNHKIIYPTEAHHIVDMGYRRLSGGHQATLPLCRWHHRGEPIAGLGNTETERQCGPSMFHTKKAFVKRYGTERELLAEVNGILEQVNDKEKPRSLDEACKAFGQVRDADSSLLQSTHAEA